jgi:hypothetical protein
LDVTFDEDCCCTRKDDSALNFAVIGIAAPKKHPRPRQLALRSEFFAA